MSIDYGFFLFQPSKVTEQMAAEWYRKACEGLPINAPADETMMTLMVRHLTENFPQLKDCTGSQLDVSPWSSDFDHSDKHLIISVSLSYPKHVDELISDGTKKFGLMMYDPQSDRAFDPAGERLGGSRKNFLARLLGF